MMNATSKWQWKAAIALGIAGVTTSMAMQPTQLLSMTVPAVSQADAKFKAAGKAAAITVYPTRVAGTAISQVGETVALLLEQRGMTNLETSATVFTPADGADLAAVAKAFGEFNRANPPTTEYALFTEFMGSKEKGVIEVRAIVVNRQGEVVWTDRQAKGDPDFDRIKPREPLQCCVLVAERLRPVLNLNDGSKPAASGKIAERWQKATGIPNKAEMDRIHQRGLAFKKSAANSTLLVYPVHAGNEFSSASAATLAKMFNEKKLIQATAGESGPQLEIARDINEQKVLWSMANAFSDYVKKNPPQADFVLFADYLMGKDAVGGVHFAICNQKGELVVVDFQNSHWPDFKAISPKSREDGDKLVAKRMIGYCK